MAITRRRPNQGRLVRSRREAQRLEHLLVLKGIRASLGRLEKHLTHAQRSDKQDRVGGSASDQRDGTHNPNTLSPRDEALIREYNEENRELPLPIEAYYYEIDDNGKESWKNEARRQNTARSFGGPSGPQGSREHVLERFPEKVSDASWKFYQPASCSSDERGYYICAYGNGLGRPNFAAAWNAPYKSASRPGSSLAVPYSIYVPYSSMSMFTSTDSYQSFPSNPFSAAEISELDRIFGGLWRLPQDQRLPLEFQDASLRAYKSTNISGELPVAITEMGKRHKKLSECGGELEVVDIDSRGMHFGYSIEHAPNPEVADEFFLKIPPRIVKVNSHGLPGTSCPTGSANWRRIITIRGLAEVYYTPPWIVKRNSAESLLTKLFEFHTSCSLRARESKKSEIFHICWMEFSISPSEAHITSKPIIHQAWKRRELLNGGDNFIGKVAGSVCYIEENEMERWTLLVLVPKRSSNSAITAISNARSISFPLIIQNSHWFVTLRYVLELMQTSYCWWGLVSDHLDQFLVFCEYEKLSTDEKLLKAKELFWVISTIDEILPLISDGLDQWKWFRNSNKLITGAGDTDWDEWTLISDNQLGLHRYPIQREEALPMEELYKALEGPVRQVETMAIQLLGSYRRFDAMRDKARSLRDGLFNLTSVKEAIDSRILGENVKFLTYVTIVYLPLGFCTSMWAINNMFGTGIKGFAIITTLLAVGTYGAVFSLLHRTRQRQAIEAMMRLFRFPWLRILPSEEQHGLKQSQDESQARETTSNEQTSTQNESGNGAQRKSLRARLGWTKREQQGNQARV